jgi:N-glycosylase/DNA lyase
MTLGQSTGSMARKPARPATSSVPLIGAGGEAVSFRATLASHGLAWIAPNEIDPDERFLRTTLALSDGTARAIALREEPPGQVAIEIAGRAPSAKARAEIVSAVRTMFALDDDLSSFYARIEHDGELRFAAAGVGRLLRSPTAFEDIVRTICTTNCAWSATERMIEALVAHLGTAAAGVQTDGWRGRAFPTPAQIADADDHFFRDVARAGYRGEYLRSFARSVAREGLDVEAWRTAPRSELSDEELEQLLLALPGVGPYAAAHAMMLFGRSSRLVLDSWTRPRYAELMGKRKIADKTIVRRFKPYGDRAGLAFWLLLWKSRHLNLEKR